MSEKHPFFYEIKIFCEADNWHPSREHRYKFKDEICNRISEIAGVTSVDLGVDVVSNIESPYDSMEIVIYVHIKSTCEQNIDYLKQNGVWVFEKLKYLCEEGASPNIRAGINDVAHFFYANHLRAMGEKEEKVNE